MLRIANKVFMVLYIVLMGNRAPSLAASTNNSPQAVLTEAKQVISLSRAEADKNHPVHVKGVITFFNFTDTLLFIQDSSAGVYVYPYRQHPLLKPGNLVEIKGTTKSGICNSVVISSQIESIGEMLLPIPKKVTIDQINSGTEDSQWVELEGIVQKEYVETQLVLEIAEFEDRLLLRIYDFPAERKGSLLDHRVKVRGVIATLHDDKKQITGFHMLVSSLADVTLIEPPITDPFSLPIKPINEVNAFPAHGVTGHHVRIKGTVTLHRSDGALFVQDDTGSIQVKTAKATRFSPGEELDIIGFALRGALSTILSETHIKQTKSDTPIKPLPVQTQDFLKGSFNNHLVQTEAYLIDVLSLDNMDTTLLLQMDQKTFQAHLPKKTSQSSFHEPSGSRLRISGICEIKRDFYQRPNGWELWMRNDKDVIVLQRPGQYYIRNLSITITAVAVCLLAVLVWLVILRRLVRKETQAVQNREQALESRYRELFENAHDIIFTIDLDGNIGSINQAGLQTLGYGINELQSMNIQVLAPSEEESKIAQLLKEAQMAGIGDDFELMLKTKEHQQIFIELKYRPDVQDGKVSGLRCIARDVTARKNAEMALSQSERQLRHLLADREKLSRDLHDDIIQSIYGVGLGLEECRRFISQDNATLVIKLNRLRDQLNQLIRNVRRFLAGQTPDILSQGLTKALETLVVRMNETHPMRCILDVDPSISGQLTNEQSTQVLHIAQEAMSNSLKHSQAKTAHICLKKTANNVQFEVKDDGCGFNPNTLPHLGYGLINMKTRAAELKGHFQLNSFPGKGTKIMVEFSIGQST